MVELDPCAVQLSLQMIVVRAIHLNRSASIDERAKLEQLSSEVLVVASVHITGTVQTQHSSIPRSWAWDLKREGAAWHP